MNIPSKQLADTGIVVSALGLGTVKLGRNQAVKYPRGFEIPDDRHVRDILALAAEAGINLLDTAPAYGVAEERLGNLVGNDDHWVICTKVGEYFHNGVSTYAYTEKETRLSVENSLRRLRRDVLDIVLIHSNGDDIEILTESDVLETLRELQSAGKIRAVGISSKTVEGGLFALEHMDLVMCTYNLAETDELPVITRAAEMNKGIFIKKGLMSGHLEVTDVEDPLLASYHHIFVQPGVTSMIVGTINPQHLKQNIDALIEVLAG